MQCFKLIVDNDIPDEMPRKIDLFFVANLIKSRGWGMSTLIVDVPDEMPRKIYLFLLQT
jgi:hypothetical protein